MRSATSPGDLPIRPVLGEVVRTRSFGMYSTAIEFDDIA